MEHSKWHISPSLLFWHVIWVEIQRASPRRDIHVLGMDPHRPVTTVYLVAQVQCHDYWCCEIVLEESIGAWACADGLK
jgi:hypothetical protein